jgi:hypothetical protein
MLTSNTSIAAAPEVAATFAAQAAAPVAVERGYYGEVLGPPGETGQLVAAVKRAAGWSEGIERLNKRGGFEARSIDVYGYDVARDLAVVQLRRTYRKKDGYYMSIDKIYALVGRDEGQIFSHILDSSPRRLKDLKEKSPESVVRWAEKMIFGLKNEADVDEIKRQGDIALIPVKALPKDAQLVEAGAVTFRKSHKLVGKIFKSAENGYFVEGGRGTRMTHAKREHSALFTSKGQVFRVVVGRRGTDPWWTDATLGD